MLSYDRPHWLALKTPALYCGRKTCPLTEDSMPSMSHIATKRQSNHYLQPKLLKYFKTWRDLTILCSLAKVPKMSPWIPSIVFMLLIPTVLSIRKVTKSKQVTRCLAWQKQPCDVLGQSGWLCPEPAETMPWPTVYFSLFCRKCVVNDKVVFQH